MTLYEYQCIECGQKEEVYREPGEIYTKPCKYCKGPMRQVFSVGGITFKGSGFYSTENRRAQ